MSLIKGFIMSLGMFSVIPVPRNSWNDKYMPIVIPNLPLVGALIGLIWYGAAYALSVLSAPLMIQSAALLFIPFIPNGFIHTDGYMDTADAVFSRRDLEEKKRILKDPHVGAFAVIALVGLFIFQFSAVYTIIEAQKRLLIFVFIPVISRCVAGAVMLNLKPVFETGYNAVFRTGTKPRHTVFICVLALICLITAGFMLGFEMLPLLVEVLVGIMAAIYLYKQFQGISGDLSGCIITVCELSALLCMAII
jgi:Cobalamin-5-phosphate synthase